MSKKSLTLSVVAIAVAIIGSSALTNYASKAKGGPIPAGGRPAKICTYSVQGSDPLTIIPSVPGEHGFIVTDIIAFTTIGTSDVISVSLQKGDFDAARILVNVNPINNTPTAPVSYHFESGLVLPAGEVFKAGGFSSAGDSLSITVSGYTF